MEIKIKSSFIFSVETNGTSRCIPTIRCLIACLPRLNRYALFSLLEFLNKVASYAQDSFDRLSGEVIQGNKMDVQNLATVIGPNIFFRSKFQESPMDQNKQEQMLDEQKTITDIVRELILNYEAIFTVCSKHFLLNIEINTHIVTKFILNLI